MYLSSNMPRELPLVQASYQGYNPSEFEGAGPDGLRGTERQPVGIPEVSIWPVAFERNLAGGDEF